MVPCGTTPRRIKNFGRALFEYDKTDQRFSSPSPYSLC